MNNCEVVKTGLSEMGWAVVPPDVDGVAGNVWCTEVDGGCRCAFLYFHEAQFNQV